MTDPTENIFGRWLRAQREDAGLSIRAAARQADISEGRWRQLEAGYQRSGAKRIPANPKPETVVRVADALGLDAETALEFAGHSWRLVDKIRQELYSQDFEIFKKQMERPDRELAQIVLDECDARGLTSEEAARRARISPKVWQRITNGEPVPISTLRKVDKLFGVHRGTVLRHKVDEFNFDLRAELAKTRRTWMAHPAGGNMHAPPEAPEEPARLRALLKRVEESLRPYTDILDATQSGLHETRIKAEVLAQLAKDVELPSSIRHAIEDLQQTAIKYSEITMDRSTWLDLTYELVDISEEIDEEGIKRG